MKVRDIVPTRVFKAAASAVIAIGATGSISASAAGLRSDVLEWAQGAMVELDHQLVTYGLAPQYNKNYADATGKTNNMLAGSKDAKTCFFEKVGDIVGASSTANAEYKLDVLYGGYNDNPANAKPQLAREIASNASEHCGFKIADGIYANKIIRLSR